MYSDKLNIFMFFCVLYNSKDLDENFLFWYQLLFQYFAFVHLIKSLYKLFKTNKLYEFIYVCFFYVFFCAFLHPDKITLLPLTSIFDYIILFCLVVSFITLSNKEIFSNVSSSKIFTFSFILSFIFAVLCYIFAAWIFVITNDNNYLDQAEKYMDLILGVEDDDLILSGRYNDPLDDLGFSLDFDLGTNNGGTPPTGDQLVVIPEDSNSSDLPERNLKRKRVSDLDSESASKKVSDLMEDKISSNSELRSTSELIRDIANKLLETFENSDKNLRRRLVIGKANLELTQLSALNEYIQDHAIEIKPVNSKVQKDNLKQHYLTRKLVDLLLNSLKEENQSNDSFVQKMNQIIDKLISQKNQVIETTLTGLNLSREEILLVEKFIRQNPDSKYYKSLTELGENCSSKVWVSKDFINELCVKFRPNGLPPVDLLDQWEKRRQTCVNELKKIELYGDSGPLSKLSEAVKEILEGKTNRAKNYCLNHVNLNEEKINLILDCIKKDRSLVSYKGDLTHNNLWKINLHFRLIESLISNIKHSSEAIKDLYENRLEKARSNSPILKAVQELEKNKPISEKFLKL